MTENVVAHGAMLVRDGECNSSQKCGNMTENVVAHGAMVVRDRACDS